MATMSGGVVERANIIDENRQVLSELMVKNEFVEPSHKELNKLFTRLNADNARELVKDLKCYEPGWQSKTVTDRLYGPVPGIPCGSWWGIRMDCSRDRMHDPFSASVQSGPVGAVSICTSHSNEDIDLGDLFTFTGQPCEDGDRYGGRLVEAKEEDEGNRSLVLNFENRVPVRIIRSYNLSNEYSPKTGYRYDGLYMVVDYWIGVSPQNGSRRCKFALRRLFHQEPPPWKLHIPREKSEPVRVLKRYSKNCHILGRGGTAPRNSSTSVNTNDNMISRRRDRKTRKVARSAYKRTTRSNERSPVPEAAQSTSTAQGSMAAQISPGRKIVSTDHRNVHVSAIVTRRVSKKLLNNSIDKKLLSDSAPNKSWTHIGGSESQVIGNEGEEEGIKSQNTRLQNTNISIRTDLYNSSHNLKQNAKKCGSNLNHGPGIFKPRALGIPRRELNFVGVDSSPGNSRLISSVKMERVKSIDSRIKTRTPKNSLCEDTAKVFDANARRSIEDEDISAQEGQSARHNEIVKFPPVPGTFSAGIKDLEHLEIPKTRCLHRIEHSYASQFPKSLAHNGNCRSPVSQTTNLKVAEKRSRDLSCGDPKSGGKTEFCEPGTSGNLAKKPNFKQIENESLTDRSPSNSPAFRGFRSPGHLMSGVEGSWSDSSLIMKSLTFEKMLDIITEEKSSPMAKMLISNVIGFRTTGSPLIFDKSAKTDTQIRNRESEIDPETAKRPFSMKTRSWGREIAANSNHTDISSTGDRQNSGKSDSRQFRRFENSRQQNIIEIVYAGEDQDETQESLDTGFNSHTADEQLTIVDRNSETAVKAREFIKKSNYNVTAVGQPEAAEEHGTKYAVTRYRSGHQSRSGENKDVYLRLDDNPDCEKSLSSLERKTQVSRPEDTVDFWSGKRIEGVVEYRDRDKSSERGSSRLTTMRGTRVSNSRPSISKSSASQITGETAKAQIITRSKYLQNSIHGKPLQDGKSKPNVTRNGGPSWNETPEDSGNVLNKKSVHNHVASNLGLRSAGRAEQSDKKIADKGAENIDTDLKSGNFATDKSPEKLRVMKRSVVRVKRKMEVANLFIDMNMSPRSQMSKSRSRRTTLRGVNRSRRRSSCPAVVDRVLKRRNNDPVKHPTSPLKRVKKSAQIQSSSVQIASAVTPKKGLSLRKRTKNGASPTSNLNNNNNNNNCVKRIGKAEKVISKIKKPMKSNGRNLVAKKSTVNGLRAGAAAEIPKRRETAVRTRSGRNHRSLQTAGRIGLRRALLTGTETYARKKKKKKKERQKQTAEKVQKQKPMPDKKHIEFAKLEYNNYKGTREAKKPKMVSVMTQCSLIPAPIRSSVASYRSRENNGTNFCGSTGYRHGSDDGSEFICSSHHSGVDQVKNEIIELIEIKSEAIDDDVANCNEEDDECDEIGARGNPNSAFNLASACLQNLPPGRSNFEGLINQEKSRIPSLRRSSQGFSALSSDSVTKKAFIPYVAGNRPSAFVPVRMVEGNLTVAWLKTIGFKPIKPGHFPSDGYEMSSEYSRRSTSDSPRIAYSSAVVKRGVHEEYDKYTSEENNVVQYMDSKLCYEDIENEDIIYGSGYSPEPCDLSNVFVQKMEFVKLGTEIEDESNDNSVIRGGEEQDEDEDADADADAVEEEEDDDDDDRAEDFEKEDVKEWQSQLDESSSISEDTEQAFADSDGDVPWHGWKKIISNQETYFVGW